MVAVNRNSLATARSCTLAAGLLLAAVVAFLIQGNVAPWGVAALGLVTGLLSLPSASAKTFLLASAGASVALIAIQVQPYNPTWLTLLVLYEKVFMTHALLAVSVGYLTGLVKDPSGVRQG